jgi:hypothetical protein
MPGQTAPATIPSIYSLSHDIPVRRCNELRDATRSAAGRDFARSKNFQERNA